MAALLALSVTAACEPTRTPNAASSPAPQSSVAATAAPAVDVAASANSAATQQAGFYRTHVGAVAITVLSDGTFGLDVDHGLALNAKPGEVDRLLSQAFQKSPIDASFNVFLLELGEKTVLIDTGAASNLGPTAGKLGQSLAHAGVRADQVSDIFLTHVHPDHTGGLVTDGKQAFPNATVHVDQKDLDYWLNAELAAKATGMQATFFGAARATLQPYADAGRLKGFAGATEFFSGFRSEPAYGHTPGHSMYVLENGGEKLLFWGDLIHIAAVQFDDPGVAVAFDVNSAMAVETRKQALAEAADRGYLVAQNHVAFPGMGHVRRDGAAYRWVPTPYVNDSVSK